MKNRNIVYALTFLLLNVLMYQGAEWLVWVFLVPFILLAVQSSLRDTVVSGSIVVALTGYLWFWWMKYYTTETLIISLIIFYVFFMCFLMLVKLICGKRKYPDRKNAKKDHPIEGRLILQIIFVPPVVWFCFQKVLSFTPVGGSWFDPAMFQPAMAPLIWVVGAKGITFMIVLFNSIVAAFLLHRTRKIATCGILLLVLIGGCIVFSNSASLEGETVQVSLLQGNFDQPWEWRREQAEKVIIDTYLDMTREIKKQKPDIIVWPEYAIPDDIFLKSHLFEKITTVTKDLGSYLILGTLIELGGKVEEQNRIHNLAALVSPMPETIPNDKYVSVRPMPFETWVVPGTKIHPLVIEKAKLGVLLCFEELLPEIASEFSRKGADLLLSLSNNSRFLQTKGVYLASLQTRLRAAENGKYLARATNTGLTQVVNPCGRVIAQAKPFSREILSTEVRLSNWVTPYARYGDKTLMIIIIISVFCIILAKNKVQGQRIKGKGKRCKVKGTREKDKE